MLGHGTGGAVASGTSTSGARALLIFRSRLCRNYH